MVVRTFCPILWYSRFLVVSIHVFLPKNLNLNPQTSQKRLLRGWQTPQKKKVGSTKRGARDGWVWGLQVFRGLKRYGKGRWGIGNMAQYSRAYTKDA